ncbi:GPN-loop GTPase 3 [Rousettus aegyptiacus]|uniref:GPN-loop GTPase 3 n=1 Tax=Rousettus aegyptiacus TaxID=9407 RepID=A0A7J8H044_ROUAE|nr:GPN-loop GTPase 3 [Rousettus aegyptiacus]KAF6465315.1 GPN-loop GTPase 3 [Rousettus aegyptiacus]
MRHRKEIHMSCKTAGSFLHSIPDPQRICKSSASSYKSNISAQTKEQSTPHRNAECHPLCVITKATRLHQLPSRRFPPTTFAHSPQTSLPPGCSLGKRFTRGLARGALRSRRCGRTDVVSRTRIVIGSHAALPELRRRRAKAEGSVAAGLLVVTVRPAAPGAGTADMPRYAQLVMGPAGSGKSTYCATMVQHCEALNRSVQVVNLDPAAEHFNYSVMADIRELIEVDDVMEDHSLRFGPNGGLIFCMEYFANNFDWLENCLGHVEDDYILFDCPGQIELYTHLPVMKQLVQQLEQWEFRVCGVFLVDSQFMVESFKFISGILAALSAMISLEIPQVNIMTKMDLLSKKAKKEIEKFLDPDMYSLLNDSTSDLRSKKFKKLTKAICGLIDDYSMVRFLPYDQSDEESMNIVLQHIDFAIQYGEDLEFKEPKEHEDESSSLFDEYFQEHQNE